MNPICRTAFCQKSTVELRPHLGTFCFFVQSNFIPKIRQTKLNQVRFFHFFAQQPYYRFIGRKICLGAGGRMLRRLGENASPNYCGTLTTRIFIGTCCSAFTLGIMYMQGPSGVTWHTPFQQNEPNNLEKSKFGVHFWYWPASHPYTRTYTNTHIIKVQISKKKSGVYRMSSELAKSG